MPDKYTHQEYIKLREILANWNPFLSVDGRIKLFDDAFTQTRESWDLARKIKPQLTFEGTSEFAAHETLRKLKMYGDEILDRYLIAFRNKLSENNPWEAQLKTELEEIINKCSGN